MELRRPSSAIAVAGGCLGNVLSQRGAPSRPLHRILRFLPLPRSGAASPLVLQPRRSRLLLLLLLVTVSHTTTLRSNNRLSLPLFLAWTPAASRGNRWRSCEQVPGSARPSRGASSAQARRNPSTRAPRGGALTPAGISKLPRKEGRGSAMLSLALSSAARADSQPGGKMREGARARCRHSADPFCRSRACCDSSEARSSASRSLPSGKEAAAQYRLREGR